MVNCFVDRKKESIDQFAGLWGLTALSAQNRAFEKYVAVKKVKLVRKLTSKQT